MKFRKLFRLAPVVCALTAHGVFGEDIDIFATNASASTSQSNVLIVLDAGANWASQVGSNWSSSVDLDGHGHSCGTGGKYFCYAKSALVSVLNGLTGATHLNIGLMMNHPNTGGGYVRFAIRDISQANATASQTNGAVLRTVLKSLSNNTLTAYNEEPFWPPRNLFATALFALVRPAHAAANSANFSDKGNNTDMSWMLNEAYRYFNRLSPVTSGNVTAVLGSGDVRDIGTVRYIGYAGNGTTQNGVDTQAMGDTGAYTSASAT